MLPWRQLTVWPDFPFHVQAVVRKPTKNIDITITNNYKLIEVVYMCIIKVKENLNEGKIVQILPACLHKAAQGAFNSYVANVINNTFKALQRLEHQPWDHFDRTARIFSLAVVLWGSENISFYLAVEEWHTLVELMFTQQHSLFVLSNLLVRLLLFVQFDSSVYHFLLTICYYLS